MNQARVGLLVVAALVAAPLTAAAQPAAEGEEIDLDEESGEGEKGAGEEGGDEEGAGEEGGDEGLGDEGDEGGLGDICQIDPEACPSIDMDAAAARPLNEEMYAVQQIYALRRERFEVNPYGHLSMNDQFVGHPGFGLGINYYITNVLAVGVNGNYHFNSNSDFNFQTSRAARVGQPLTEYQWSAYGNFSYVPAYGKFAGFGDFIFHYDIYVLGGIGAVSTRPIAVVDPDNRTFDYGPKLSFHLPSAGLRIFFNRWLAANLEVSEYFFIDELENPVIASGVDSSGRPLAQDESTWLSDESEPTVNIQAQIGLSIFLPPTWEYRLPK